MLSARRGNVNSLQWSDTGHIHHITRKPCAAVAGHGGVAGYGRVAGQHKLDTQGRFHGVFLAFFSWFGSSCFLWLLVMVVGHFCGYW